MDLSTRLCNIGFIAIALLFFNQSLSAQDALAKCNGTNDQYVIEVTGLLDGDIVTVGGAAPVTISGGGTDLTSAPFTFAGGNTKTTVTVNRSGTISTFDVNEVLCRDIDNDGLADFNKAACDYTQPFGSTGTIISTVAPFAGANTYLYLLTDSTGAFIESSNSGHFTGLDTGYYQVHAFNFADQTDISGFLAAISPGDDINLVSGDTEECYVACGIAGPTNVAGNNVYVIDCAPVIEITADPSDDEVCEDETANFTATADYVNGFTPLVDHSITYQWQRSDDGVSWTTVSSGTSVPSTADSIDVLNPTVLNDNGDLYRMIYTLEYSSTALYSDTTLSSTLTVNPVPVLASNLDTTVMSGEDIGVILAIASGSAPTDTFDITTIDIPAGLTANTSTATGQYTDANEISLDNFTNETGGPLVVTYTVTPINSHGCAGDPVDIKVTITSCPVIADIDIASDVCSGDVVTVNLPGTSDAPGSMTMDSFLLTGVTLNGATADAGNATAGTKYYSGDPAITDTYDNATASSIDVEYSFTGWSAGCSVDFTITATILPAITSDLTEYDGDEFCNNYNITISEDTLLNKFTNLGGSPSITWSSGSPTLDNSGDLSETLTNAGTADITVKYYVQASDANGCTKLDSFEVTVHPSVTVDALTDPGATCSTKPITLADLNGSYTGPSGQTMTWGTTGDGQFLDASDAVSTDFATATKYVPGTNDKSNGSVEIILSVAGVGSCPGDSEFITVSITNIECATFPWDGN